MKNKKLLIILVALAFFIAQVMTIGMATADMQVPNMCAAPVGTGTVLAGTNITVTCSSGACTIATSNTPTFTGVTVGNNGVVVNGTNVTPVVVYETDDPTRAAAYIQSGTAGGGFVVLEAGAVKVNISRTSSTFNETGSATGDFRVESDNKEHALFVNASTDMVGINTPAPLTMFHVAGNSTFQGFVNATGFINAGNIRSVGLMNADTFILNVPVWDDLRVPLSGARPDAGAPPTWTAAIGNIAMPEFTDASDKYVHLVAQMPHGYKTGTTLEGHVHWTPGSNTNTGNVEWVLECTGVKNVDQTWASTTTTYTGITNIPSNSSYKHIETDIGSITVAADANGSSMLGCRLNRNTSTSGDLTGSVWGLEVDFHYQLDRLGSATEVH